MGIRPEANHLSLKKIAPPRNVFTGFCWVRFEVAVEERMVMASPLRGDKPPWICARFIFQRGKRGNACGGAEAVAKIPFRLYNRDQPTTMSRTNAVGSPEGLTSQPIPRLAKRVSAPSALKTHKAEVDFKWTVTQDFLVAVRLLSLRENNRRTTTRRAANPPLSTSAAFLHLNLFHVNKVGIRNSPAALFAFNPTFHVRENC